MFDAGPVAEVSCHYFDVSKNIGIMHVKMIRD